MFISWDWAVMTKSCWSLSGSGSGFPSKKCPWKSVSCQKDCFSSQQGTAWPSGACALLQRRSALPEGCPGSSFRVSSLMALQKGLSQLPSVAVHSELKIMGIFLVIKDSLLLKYPMPSGNRPCQSCWGSYLQQAKTICPGSTLIIPWWVS